MDLPIEINHLKTPWSSLDLKVLLLPSLSFFFHLELVYFVIVPQHYKGPLFSNILCAFKPSLMHACVFFVAFCNCIYISLCLCCRYGNGAFLVCLEALYKKVTGKALEYTGLIGKPSEVTYRFAEHVLSEQAIRLSIKSPLKRMYLVG